MIQTWPSEHDNIPLYVQLFLSMYCRINEVSNKKNIYEVLQKFHDPSGKGTSHPL